MVAGRGYVGTPSDPTLDRREVCCLARAPWLALDSPVRRISYWSRFPFGSRNAASGSHRFVFYDEFEPQQHCSDKEGAPMALFVYPTERFLGDTRSVGISQDRVRSLAAQLERSQSFERFDSFKYPYFVKKKQWDYNRRLVAAEVQHGEHLVLVFLRLLGRGDLEWRQFNNDPDSEMGSLLAAATQEIPAWLQQRTTVDPPPGLPAPTEPQRSFLWSQHAGDTAADAVVCETRAWMEAMRESRIRERLILLPNFLLELVGGNAERCETRPCPADPRLSVAYRWLPADQNNIAKLVLLAAGYDASPNAEAEQQRLLGREGRADHSNALRLTHRGYPAEILCDENFWIDIQKDEASNLSLSPEEAGLLQSVRTLDGSGGFPMFINGRAGSGKSTLLQYVFADYFRAWLEHLQPEADAQDSVPLYLAASHELLKNASRHVRGLLTFNANQLLQRQPITAEQGLLLSHAFRTPEEYFLQILAEKGRVLSSANRVTYPRFRQMWSDHCGNIPNARREFGPQLSWHVIRTHIKGQSLDGVLEPEDYDTLPPKEKTVTKERYRNVFNRVWNWYDAECREQGLWDDQDLALWVVESDFQGAHAALFCDEAQDFTRRQLDALRRCSAFSFLALNPQEAERVPLVFAGDPFQTLNPTGFRWQAVRAAFTEKLAANMQRYTRRDQIPEIRYRELTYNYRSADPVVKFCNTLQAVRATVMDEPSLRPQTTWHLDETAPLPMHFGIDDPSFEAALREQPDLVIIVPCEEDEEAAYVKKHPPLDRLVRMDEAGIPQNVLSPARAKGLEFKRVAVVGFASAEEAAALSRAIAGANGEQSSDARLPLEYFLNKLYVACSRARRRLFIVDKSDALRDFWGFATELPSFDALAETAPGGAEIWRDNLGGLVKGGQEHWGDDHNDPLEMAEGYEKEGESQRAPYYLFQAALQYEQIGRTQKAAECRARGYHYDNKPREAGEWFVKAANPARALECFWEAERDHDVVAAADMDPALRTRLEYRLSALLCGRDGTTAAPLDLLREIVDRAGTDPSFKARVTGKAWGRAVRNLLANAHQRLAGTADAAAWIPLADMYRLTQNIGIQSPVESLAGALLNAGRFDEVVTLPGLSSDSPAVRTARFRLIVARHAANPTATFSDEECRTVADQYLETNMLEEAVPWCERAGSASGLETILAKAAATESLPVAGSAAAALVNVIVKRPDWTELPSLLEGRIGRTRSQKTENFLRRVFERDRILERVLLPACAFSENASTMPPNLKDRVLAPLRTIQPQPMGNWPEDMQHHVKLYGAAVERLGKDIDALEYYERITSDKSIPEPLLHYCEKRWIHCKKRQEQRERYMGRRQTADRHREAIEGKLRTYRWTEDDLGPEYPDRRTVGRSQASDPGFKASREPIASSTTAQLGGYTIQTFPAARRINVVSTETGDIVRIDLAGRRVTSAEVGVVEGDQSTWTVPDWGVSIAMDSVDSGLSIQANDATWTAPASLTATVPATVGNPD